MQNFSYLNFSYRLESSGGWHSWCSIMWSISEAPSSDVKASRPVWPWGQIIRPRSIWPRPHRSWPRNLQPTWNNLIFSLPYSQSIINVHSCCVLVT